MGCFGSNKSIKTKTSFFHFRHLERIRYIFVLKIIRFASNVYYFEIRFGWFGLELVHRVHLIQVEENVCDFR